MDGTREIQGTAAELKRSVGGELISLTAGPNGLPMEKLKSLEFVEDVISAEGEVRVVVRDAEAALLAMWELELYTCAVQRRPHGQALQ